MATTTIEATARTAEEGVRRHTGPILDTLRHMKPGQTLNIVMYQPPDPLLNAGLHVIYEGRGNYQAGYYTGTFGVDYEVVGMMGVVHMYAGCMKGVENLIDSKEQDETDAKEQEDRLLPGPEPEPVAEKPKRKRKAKEPEQPQNFKELLDKSYKELSDQKADEDAEPPKVFLENNSN